MTRTNLQQSQRDDWALTFSKTTSDITKELFELVPLVRGYLPESKDTTQYTRKIGCRHLPLEDAPQNEYRISFHYTYKGQSVGSETIHKTDLPKGLTWEQVVDSVTREELKRLNEKVTYNLHNIHQWDVSDRSIAQQIACAFFSVGGKEKHLAVTHHTHINHPKRLNPTYKGCGYSTDIDWLKY